MEQIAKVGDYIQWTSNGADQLSIPRWVEWVSDDNEYVRVFGSPTGIPMSEVTIVTQSGDTPPPIVGVAKKLAEAGHYQPAVSAPTASTAPAKDITVYQVNGRLQITADVDAEGLKKLQNLLAKYAEVLALMN